MAGFSERELEQRLKDAGRRLDPLPRTKEDLLRALEEVEKYLSMVEQSPSKCIEEAVNPTQQALVKAPLLRHQDKDVRLLVVACISEITRITAPDAPYNDDQMKEVFQLIVGSFEGFKEPPQSVPFNRRLSILETVAKVRSCVVMLDLECDDLILEMFQHFFNTTSPRHPENVRISMQTIMQLVVDESEDISQQLLSVLLSYLRREKRESSAAAHKLAVSVVKNCAEKLRPYLASEMSAEGFTPSELKKEYHEIVYEICRDGHNALTLHADSENEVERGSLPKFSVENNTKGVIEGPVSPNVERENSVIAKQIANEEKQNLECGMTKLDAEKPEHEVNDSEGKDIHDGNEKESAKESLHDSTPQGAAKSNKGRRSGQSRRLTSAMKGVAEKGVDSKDGEGERPSSSMKERRRLRKTEHSSNKTSDENLDAVDTDSLPTGRRRGPVRENRSSTSKSQLTKANEPVAQDVVDVHPTESQLVETAETKSATATVSNRDVVGTTTHSSKKKEMDELPSSSIIKSEGVNTAPESGEAGTSSPVPLGKDEVPTSAKSVTGKDDTPASELPRPKRGRPRSAAKLEVKEDKVAKDADKLDSTISRRQRAKRDVESDKSSVGSISKRLRRSSDSGAVKGLDKQLSKKQEAADVNESMEVAGEGQRSKKNVPGHGDSTLKETSQAAENSKRTPRSSVKGASGVEKTPTSVKGNIENGSMIGRKIKVWWPHDKQYYEGEISSFDKRTGRYRIAYDDGDVENLKLEKQKWMFVEQSSADKSVTPPDTTSKLATEKPSKQQSSKGETMKFTEATMEESHVKRGRKKSKPESDVKLDANGSGGKNLASEFSNKVEATTSPEPTLSPETTERLLSSPGGVHKDGSRKRKALNASSTPTNGTAKKPRGRGKASVEQEKTSTSSDGVERNSDDEPLNAWRSRARSEQ